MELEINGQFYNFRFGVGFLRKIQAKVKETNTQTMVQMPNGFKYLVSYMMDGDTTALEDILLTANETEKPRISKQTLEDYLDDDETDIQGLIDTVIDFLSKASACKPLMDQINQTLKEAEENRKRFEALKNIGKQIQ